MEETIKSEQMQQKEIDHKNIAVEFFNLLIQGKFKEGVRFFSPECKTHNPYTSGNMDTLTDAMMAAAKDMTLQGSDMELTVKHVLADGDFIAVHTQLLNHKSKIGEGGLRQVHLFRFEGDKIIEYWDITQVIIPNIMPNAAGAF